MSSTMDLALCIAVSYILPFYIASYIKAYPSEEIHFFLSLAKFI